jgi:hypothetical protein
MMRRLHITGLIEDRHVEADGLTVHAGWVVRNSIAFFLKDIEITVDPIDPAEPANPDADYEDFLA